MKQAPSYETRRRQDSYQRRLAVLAAAGSIFAKSGYRGATMEDIAKAAGVSKGLVFHFFGSKQKLFQALVEDCLNQWLALSEHRASEAEESSLQELRSLFLASFEFVEQNPVLLLFSGDKEHLLDEYRLQLARRNKRWRERIRRSLKTGMARSEIRSVDVTLTATLFHELQTALIANVSFRGTAPRYDRQKVNLAVDIFLQGIRATQ